MKPMVMLAVAALVVLGLSACTAGTTASHHAAGGGDLAQLFLGLWQGLIAPFTLIGEIIGRVAPHVLPWRLHMYETKDTGVAYDAGFLIGLAGGPTAAWRSWSSRR